jgi:hypothetical protein
MRQQPDAAADLGGDCWAPTLAGCTEKNAYTVNNHMESTCFGLSAKVAGGWSGEHTGAELAVF